MDFDVETRTTRYGKRATNLIVLPDADVSENEVESDDGNENGSDGSDFDESDCDSEPEKQDDKHKFNWYVCSVVSMPLVHRQNSFFTTGEKSNRLLHLVLQKFLLLTQIVLCRNKFQSPSIIFPNFSLKS